MASSVVVTLLTRWLHDPKLARQLARATWVVLVAAFVLLTRFQFGASTMRLLLAGLIVAVGALNTPVVLGLWQSRPHAHTAAFRFVAVALAMRLAATAWVVWLLTP
jgi:hypothetical protein